MSKLVYVLGIVFAIIGSYILVSDQSTDKSLEYFSNMAQDQEKMREAFKAEGHSAFVVGYTGESGKALVNELLSSKVFPRIVLLGRRDIQYDEELTKGVLVEQHKIDFEKIDEYADLFDNIHDGFCCLGTTRGKSGSDGFYKVDHDYTMGVGNLAKKAGVQHFHLVSSQGANKNSWILYPKTKGQVEEELKALEFGRLSIYRPAVLMCEREESRPGEAVARTLLKPFAWAFPTAITTPVETLANAMINHAVAPGDGKPWTLLENKAIHKLAKQPKQ